MILDYLDENHAITHAMFRCRVAGYEWPDTRNWAIRSRCRRTILRAGWILDLQKLRAPKSNRPQREDVSLTLAANQIV